MGLLLFLLLLFVEAGELLGNFRAVRADLAMVAQLATLSKIRLAQVALEGFLTGVSILVLLLVLLQAERLRAEATLEVFLRVVFFVVSLQAEFSLEGSCAPKNIALKDGRALLTLRPIFFCLKRAA